MSTSAPTSCPTSWTADDYCTCPATPPSTCLLWGVPYPWLIISVVIWLLAALSGRLIDLLIALLGLILDAYKRPEWTVIVKKNMIYWTNILVWWGLIWAGFKTLHLPSNVYNVLRYFFSIPFFALLFPWVNVLFNCVTSILCDYIERKGSKIKRQTNSDAATEYDKLISEQDMLGTENATSQNMSEQREGENDQGQGGEEKLAKVTSEQVALKKNLVRSHGVMEFLRVIKYLTFIFLFILALQSNNIPVVAFFQDGTLLTLSIVFAVQPWMRNLVGGLLIFFDNKYSIEDNVRVVGIEGVVKGITLRTTMIQRPDKSIVYIPNSRVLEQPVLNLSRRKARLLELRVHLCHSTSSAQIRTLIATLEHSLSMLHPSLMSHPSNRAKKTIDKSFDKTGTGFFVVLENMFQLLIWTHTTGEEVNDQAFAEIQSEVMLSVQETMQRLGVKSYAGVQDDDEREPELARKEDLQDQKGNPLLYSDFDPDDYKTEDIDYALASASMLSANPSAIF